MSFVQSAHNIFCQFTVGKYYVSALQTQVFHGMSLHWMGIILLLVTSNLMPILTYILARNSLENWLKILMFCFVV